MAEAFARRYGSDVLHAASAGVAPAASVSRDTELVMKEKNIDLRVHFPKSLRSQDLKQFDLIVNMSGSDLGRMAAPVRQWTVPDPIGAELEIHRTVRDQIEMRVMQLILELRRSSRTART
jgi:protein-tyrosine-phosphatase